VLLLDTPTIRMRFRLGPTVWDHVRLLAAFADALLVLSTEMLA